VRSVRVTPGVVYALTEREMSRTKQQVVIRTQKSDGDVTELSIPQFRRLMRQQGRRVDIDSHNLRNGDTVETNWATYRLKQH